MIELQQKRQLAGLDRFQPIYHVEGDDGIAYIELQPTTESGQVALDFAFQSEAGSSATCAGSSCARGSTPSSATGCWSASPRASLGYSTLAGNKQALEEADHEDDVVTDGQVSFYAKGRVLGKWLLTLAYDRDQRDGAPAPREPRSR